MTSNRLKSAMAAAEAPPAPSIAQRPLSSPLDPKQPYLDEANEFRRMMDNKRAEALSRIASIENDMEAKRLELEQMAEQKGRLQLIVDVCAQGLVIIPGPREATSIEQEHPVIDQ